METAYIARDNEAMPEFATMIVHEVRNPLTNIKLSVGMISAKAKDDDIQKYLDIISKNSQKIDDLITQLLKPSFTNQNTRETIWLHTLLDEVVYLSDDRLQLKEIEVTKEYDVEDIEISINISQIKIALTNIIINAIDAVAPQTGKLKLVTKSIGNHYILRIEDNGCGIKPAHLNEIFKPYFTNKPDGLGLGLTATQRILHSNNVEIIVGSKLGSGTAFTLLFNKNQLQGPVESQRFDGLVVVPASTFE
jgi:signal transduction histidine kinase